LIGATIWGATIDAEGLVLVDVSNPEEEAAGKGTELVDIVPAFVMVDSGRLSGAKAWHTWEVSVS